MTLNTDSSGNVVTNGSLAGAGRLLPDPPGVQLQRARQIKHLDLVAVADELNLSSTVVKALEADDYERLPGATFVRGYIRSYARLLKLSGDDLVRCYDRVVKGRAVDPQSKLRSEAQSSVKSGEKSSAKPAAKTSSSKKGWFYVMTIVVVGAFGITVGSQYISVEPKETDIATNSLSEDAPELTSDPQVTIVGNFQRRIRPIPGIGQTHGLHIGLSWHKKYPPQVL